MIGTDPLRWAWALAMLASYAAMCVAIVRAQRARRPSSADAAAGQAGWLVAYASQTGTCEYLAQQTVATLRTGGLHAHSASLEQIDATLLRGAERILFIVSTYGEGDAPDSGARFAHMLAGADFALDQLHYAVLALGDSSYTHFCGFGRSIDATLQARGAHPLFERIDVDRNAAPAIQAWQHHLSHLAGTSDAPDWSAPAYGDWRIIERTLLNPGSAGAPVYKIAMAPASGALPDWAAGDLVQLSAPADPDFPREYSIASIAADGRVELFVRLHLRDDGSAGVASAWLCQQASPQDPIALRLRQHSRFRIGANAGRPLVLVGNGTGIAGLRAHLKERIAAGHHRNWLVYGERQLAHDHFCASDIAAWQAAGQLGALSLAFSRDGGQVRYVQHALASHADQLHAWVTQGAAIYVCGSLQGMAAGVHDTLVGTLGQETVDRLDADGRYRRDVY